MEAKSSKGGQGKGLSFTKDQLIDLHWTQGRTLASIAAEHGVRHQSIRYWMLKHGLGKKRTEVKELLFEPSPALSYVIGVLHGDGFLYVSKDNKKHIVTLSVTDLEFAESFKRGCAHIGSYSGICAIPPQVETHKPQWKVSMSSVEFSRFWRGMSAEERLNIGMRFPADFVRGWYESEGCIQDRSDRFAPGRNLELSICTTNKLVIDRVFPVLAEKGFSPKIYTRVLPSGKDFYTINLYQSLAVRRFIAWCQPVIKIRPRRHVNTEPSLDGDVQEGVESTKASDVKSDVE